MVMTDPTRDTATTSGGGSLGGVRLALQHTRRGLLRFLPFQVVEEVRTSTSDDLNR